MLAPKQYSRIVLSGGETKGFALLGALEHFWQQNAISAEGVTHYAGASIGSLLALLLVCGYSPIEVWKEAYDVDTLSTRARTNPLRSIPNGVGLMPISGVAAIERARELVDRKFGKIPTMRELYDLTGKTLVVSVSNYTHNRAEYCSHTLTPNLSCLEAVMESCSLPGIFQRICRDGCTYVDGGLTDNFPLEQIDDGTAPLLGLATCADGPGLSRADDNILRYLVSALVAMPVSMNTKRTIRDAGANCDVFELAVESVSPFEFITNHERRLELFVAGYNFVKEIRVSHILEVRGVALPFAPNATIRTPTGPDTAPEPAVSASANTGSPRVPPPNVSLDDLVAFSF